MLFDILPLQVKGKVGRRRFGRSADGGQIENNLQHRCPYPFPFTYFFIHKVLTRKILLFRFFSHSIKYVMPLIFFKCNERGFTLFKIVSGSRQMCGIGSISSLLTAICPRVLQ